MHQVKVMRGKHRDREDLFGPLPGYRHENVVAYEFELPESFEPWPGRSRLERTFVLLDVGVSFANPCWKHWRKPDGSFATREHEGSDSWYVDLISVDSDGETYRFLDLYIDVVVTTDGRGYRILDLDEYADALESGELDLEAGFDGLRRWQRFLDRYLHDESWASSKWHDFPPKCIRELRQLGAPLGEVVTFQE